MRSILLILLTGIFSLRSTATSGVPSVLTVKLHSPVSEYSLSAATLLEALSKIAAQFNLRMGVEWVGDTQHLRTIQLSFKNTTPEQILSAVLRSQAGYEYSVQNEVLHVCPRAFLAGKQTFLDIPLKSFDVRDDYVMRANLRLIELVRSKAQEMLPNDIAAGPSGIGGSFGTGLGDRRVSFRLANVTVREVLDRLVLSADFQMWVVTYMPDKGAPASGFPWVVSIFNWDITENYQPIWDLLVRGFDPTALVYRPEWVPDAAGLRTTN